MAERAGLVMVVDDDPDIREAMIDLLQDHAFDVATAKNGDDALNVLGSLPVPMAIITDLIMPVMNGWELVSRIRAEQRFEEVPIIVTSAVGERAPPRVDYVFPKPLDLSALLGTLSEIVALAQKPAEPVTVQLRDAERRNRELADLLRFRDEIAALAVHDLRNPLSVIIGSLDYALAGALTDNSAEKIEALRDAAMASRRMLRLMANLVDVNNMEMGRFELRRAPTALDELLQTIVEGRHYLVEQTGIRFTAASSFIGLAHIDADVVTRTIENILDNAFRHTGSGGAIEIVARGEETLRIEIGNSGPVIPPNARAGIFDARQAVPGRARLELGLYFCRLALEAHGAQIWIESKPTLPTVFVLEFPFSGS
jgi:signal transduction histidine kinase